MEGARTDCCAALDPLALRPLRLPPKRRRHALTSLWASVAHASRHSLAQVLFIDFCVVESACQTSRGKQGGQMRVQSKGQMGHYNLRLVSVRPVRIIDGCVYA